MILRLVAPECRAVLIMIGRIEWIPLVKGKLKSFVRYCSFICMLDRASSSSHDTSYDMTHLFYS